MTDEEKKERRTASDKKYMEKNKEKIKANYEKNKEKIKARNKEYKQTTEGIKSNKISQWKTHYKIISDDWTATYDWFMNTKNCQKCKIEFVSGRGKHLDHNHAITDGPNTRAVLCMSCNINEGKKIHASKEEYDKHYKENIKCDCGTTTSRKNMYKHKKSAKHINFHINLNA